MIVTAIKNNPNQVIVLQKGFGAVQSLTYQSDSNSERVKEAGGIELVVGVIKHHSNSVNVQSGITVLLNLACHSLNVSREMTLMLWRRIV